MVGEKWHRILRKSRQEKMPFQPGDAVANTDAGYGIVVGFSDQSGEPYVFFYSTQALVCIGNEMLSAVSDDQC